MKIPRLGTWLLDVVAIGAVIAAAGLLIARASRAAEHNHEMAVELAPGLTIELEGVLETGSASAPVVMLEFTDFHCPSCIRYSKETFPAIRTRLIQSGRLAYVFVNAPAVSLHPFAPAVAKAALCIGQQNLFWTGHDLLFGAGKTGAHTLEVALSTMALDKPRYAVCLQDPETEKRLKQDLQIAKQVGIAGTPTFLIGRRRNGFDIDWVFQVDGTHTAKEFENLSREVAGLEPRTIGKVPN
jgi:protein-disulfide isomerase